MTKPVRIQGLEIAPPRPTRAGALLLACGLSVLALPLLCLIDLLVL